MNNKKRKGDRYEKSIIKELEKLGYNVVQVGLSLQAGRKFKGDIVINSKIIGEVKYRKDGFKTIYKWLIDRDVLFIKAQRKKWLIVIPIEKLKNL